MACLDLMLRAGWFYVISGRISCFPSRKDGRKDLNSIRESNILVYLNTICKGCSLKNVIEDLKRAHVKY